MNTSKVYKLLMENGDLVEIDMDGRAKTAARLEAHRIYDETASAVALVIVTTTEDITLVAYRGEGEED